VPRAAQSDEAVHARPSRGRLRARARRRRTRSYLNVESILKHGLDKQPLQLPVQSDEEPPPLDHENIRGPDYYH
jgi:hypothetical protein